MELSSWFPLPIAQAPRGLVYSKCDSDFVEVPMEKESSLALDYLMKWDYIVNRGTEVGLRLISKPTIPLPGLATSRTSNEQHER